MSEPSSEHTLTAVGVVLDCRDPITLADFWQQAVGFEVRTGDGQPYITLSGSDLRRPLNHLTLQKVPETKAAKNRCHIDLFARDAPAEIHRLQLLGASVTSRLPEADDDGDLIFAEMADPEGNEFCVVASPGSTGSGSAGS